MFGLFGVVGFARKKGFRQNRSTITQLLLYCNRLYELLEANKMPMTVYLDRAKAFDTINYNIILLKLCRMRFDSAFLRFFASYLTDRHQRVLISCGKSDFRPITSGGPQRSIYAVFLFFRLYKWPTRNNYQWVLFIRGWHKNCQHCKQ